MAATRGCSGTREIGRMIKVRARKTGANPPFQRCPSFSYSVSMPANRYCFYVNHAGPHSRHKQTKISESRSGGKIGPGHSPAPHTRARLSCSFLTCARIELGERRTPLPSVYFFLLAARARREWLASQAPLWKEHSTFSSFRHFPVRCARAPWLLTTCCHGFSIKPSRCAVTATLESPLNGKTATAMATN
jgi:hypothetical protein